LTGELNQMQILKPEDLVLITNMAQAAGIIHETYEKISNGELVEVKSTGDGNVPSAYWRIWKETQGVFMGYAKALGIGPLARQKLYDARVMTDPDGKNEINLD